MDKISNLVESLYSDMVETRRFFHSYPESGWFTFFTTAKIATKMKSFGYDIALGEKVVAKDAMQGVGSDEAMQKALEAAKKRLEPDEIKLLDEMKGGLTGLVATIKSKNPGPVTAFRFDIDGVDVTENKTDNHRPFKDGFRSQNDGVTHACGHDSHITIGLFLAKCIAENIDDFKGEFRFIFQTAEEGTRGAVGMEKAGVVKGVDYLFGAHMGFQCKQTHGFIAGVNKLLATTKFDVNFKGKSAHAAGAPQDGANALLAAAQAALLMHGITRHAGGVTRVNVGVLRAGEGRNVIAPNGFMACETRGETTELNDFMREKAYDIVEGVSKAFGVTSEITITGGTSGGDSSPVVTDIFYKAAMASPFVDDDKIVKNYDFGACEDYAHFMHAVQQQGGESGYAMIGTNLKAGHHNECFDFDEESLKAGLDVFLRVAYEVNAK
ncbi:MAG: amidohydrolase [Campylobacter sp.]|nr:amidohydrolase [Campylobacter sp.]